MCQPGRDSILFCRTTSCRELDVPNTACHRDDIWSVEGKPVIYRHSVVHTSHFEGALWCIWDTHGKAGSMSQPLHSILHIFLSYWVLFTSLFLFEGKLFVLLLDLVSFFSFSFFSLLFLSLLSKWPVRKSFCTLIILVNTVWPENRLKYKCSVWINGWN